MGLKPCVLGNARQHARPDLVAVMKGNHEIRVAGAFENAVRTCLTFGAPAQAKRRRQETLGLD